MTNAPDILCIGAVMWDIIGRAACDLHPGSDVAGRIRRVPGGVALNIAMALKAYGMRPAVLGHVGLDPEGDQLMAEMANLGVVTRYLTRSAERPTDQYMAIEGTNGVAAAIADAHSLEQAGLEILAPLRGDLRDWTGPVALDGNLTQAQLADVAQAPELAQADLRVAPASPGKADRLAPLLGRANATLYLNRGEVEVLLGGRFATSADAARALCAHGAARAVVTDSAQPACFATSDVCVTATPPDVTITRLTGAGDTFMAAHITAEVQGAELQAALTRAVEATARYISGERY